MKFICIFLLLMSGVFMTQAQKTIKVDVNLDLKHSVDGISTFDRSKYMILHADINDNSWDSNAQREQFLEDYDVYLGRNNGGMVWEYDQSSEDPVKPGWPDIEALKTKGQRSREDYANNVASHAFEKRYGNMMFGGQPTPMYPNGQMTRPSNCCSSSDPWAYEGYEATAEYYAQYLKEFFGEGNVSGKPRPQYVEVLNEPFVKANKLGTTRSDITRMHKVVAKRIKELNPTIKVGGYSAAHPAFEEGNFNHWRNNWKLFIDEAGEDMDFFSVHLYDFLGEDDLSLEAQRKGSNAEAILDMIEHYSYLKLGEPKPFSISEYGWLGRPLNGPYNKARDWFNIRSFSSFMMQLMERPNRIASAIPFMLLKATWWPSPGDYGYSYRLLRQKKELEGDTGDEWVYTEFVQYFQLWSDVKGTRVDTYATDPDLLVDAYVEGNQAFVILSNFEHAPVSVALNIPLLSTNPASEVTIKHSFADADGVPILMETTGPAPQKVDLGREATMILAYTLSNSPAIKETAEEQKLYAETYLHEIRANKEIQLNINGATVGPNGEAILRIGMGRAHGLSLQPTLKVNGRSVTVSSDWKGYDQKTRDSFFGVVEVPIPFNLIEESNTISLTFPDNGGFVSSMGMQVFNFSRPVNRPTAEVVTAIGGEPLGDELHIFPNPVHDQLTIGNNTYGKLEITLLDMLGKELMNTILSTAHQVISLRAIPTGSYLLQVKQSDNTRVMKLIKE